MVFAIVLPIMIQNLVNTLVNSVDIIMLSYVDQVSLSASSLANQPYNILSFIFYGISSGSAILAAQYWGKRDLVTIEKILGIALRIALTFSLIFAVAACFFSESVMQFYTSDPEVIDAGIKYLQIISLTYIFSAITQMYLCIQRCVERVRLSTAVLSTSLFLNVALNACFIFGIGFFPKMGLTGVAIATCIARLTELIICLIDSLRNKLVKIHISYLWARNRTLFLDFMKYSIPALANDVVASVGWSMYSVILGHLGSDIVAANAIAVVARNWGTVLCFGIANGCAIILGRTLGANQLALAKEYAKRFLRLGLCFGIFGGILILLFRPLFLNMGHLSECAIHYLNLMLFINAYYVIGIALNSTWISSVFRAGGDSKFGFLCDLFTLWCWIIPIGFFLAFYLKLSPMLVYIFLSADEFFKIPFVYRHYKKYGWLKNITR